MQISTPTVVQSKSFVPLLMGRDAVVCSETGSGKTLAYLLPILNKALFLQEKKYVGGLDLLGRSNPPSVVLCPTVELCRQVIQVAQQLDNEGKISIQTLNEGVVDSSSNVMESPRIRWGAVDLVVATPSRFVQDIDRFKQDRLLPSSVVFDEADLMFHGAYQSDILNIVDYLRPRVIKSPLAQCVFVSATIPEIGNRTIGPMLTQRFSTAENIRVEGFHSIPSSIGSLEWVPELKGDWQERCFLLTKVLHEQFSDKRVIVFVNTVSNCNLLYQFLREKKWPVGRFYRSSSNDLVDTRKAFDDSVSVLVATDVAARGIDWEGVDAVINFQMPTDVVTWLHRAGRCGRVGKAGSVVSFYKEKEIQLVTALREKLEQGETVDKLFSRKRSLKRKLVHSM
jgi:superfamily II DNA/RNA helicase